MKQKYIVNNLVESQGLGNQLWCILKTKVLCEKFKNTFPLYVIGNLSNFLLATIW